MDCHDGLPLARADASTMLHKLNALEESLPKERRRKRRRKLEERLKRSSRHIGDLHESSSPGQSGLEPNLFEGPTAVSFLGGLRGSFFSESDAFQMLQMLFMGR